MIVFKLDLTCDPVHGDDVYGNILMPHRCVCRWIAQFKEGYEHFQCAACKGRFATGSAKKSKNTPNLTERRKICH